ncbi:hypothetical protein M422DRAFT_187997, partial [Sphaerobolus stellatus SS14]
MSSTRAGTPDPAEIGQKPTDEASLHQLLGQILETLHASEFFPDRPTDVRSLFWTSYQRLANETDEAFLERHNSNVDVLLIFAGLFSAVSAAFIVGMDADDTIDTTNDYLKLLVQAAYNRTAEPESLTPPPSSHLWIEALAYASLTFSLLAAFGGVLGKQW